MMIFGLRIIFSPWPSVPELMRVGGNCIVLTGDEAARAANGDRDMIAQIIEWKRQWHRRSA